MLCSLEPRRIRHIKPTDPAFPPTPALSLRERENRSLVIGLSATLALIEKRDTWLPLPKGEGRGEGEGRVRRQGVEVSKAGFTGSFDGSATAHRDHEPRHWSAGLRPGAFRQIADLVPGRRPALRFMGMEQQCSLFGNSNDASFADRRATILPLLWGEGWGEGKAFVPNAVDAILA
ncbi:MAG: hypothetical protein DME26_17310 [Verrucomicrobia bacterium]|nr:MAG: hypothetical protein DME26_17310 [Verrucomicrobiota bacterium]